jgi:hypothetical protein
MAKKPWRTVQFGEDTGRFTRQQYADAVRAVKERNEAGNRKGRHPARRPADAERPATVSSAPKPRSESEPSARSKSTV